MTTLTCPVPRPTGISERKNAPTTAYSWSVWLVRSRAEPWGTAHGARLATIWPRTVPFCEPEGAPPAMTIEVRSDIFGAQAGQEGAAPGSRLASDDPRDRKVRR